MDSPAVGAGAAAFCSRASLNAVILHAIVGKGGSIMISGTELREVAGLFCSGVVAVTANCNGVPRGFTAQSFVSVSLNPALIAVCPGKSSQSWPFIRESGGFCVNIFEAHQKQICSRLAKSDDDKFSDISWRPARSGAPVLDGCLAYLDCSLEAEHDAGDHTIAVGRVLEAWRDHSPLRPLLYFKSAFAELCDPQAGLAG